MGHSVQLLRFDGAQPSRGKQGSKQNKEDNPEKMASFRAECCSPMMQAASKLERMILFCGLCTGPRAKSQHLRNVDHPSASFILLSPATMKCISYKLTFSELMFLELIKALKICLWL